MTAVPCSYFSIV